MKRRNWAECIWIALAVLEALAMLADLIGGQDPYRHQVMRYRLMELLQEVRNG